MIQSSNACVTPAAQPGGCLGPPCMSSMVARAQPPEQGLQAQDAATRLSAVRELKNQVIGNKFKKLEKLYLVPLLLKLVASNEQPELQVQAIATLGSLAYGVEDGVRAIVAASGIPAIMAALESSDQRVVVAAARSLKLLYQSPLAPHEPLLAGPTLQRLVGLLQDCTQQGAVATAAASVLAHCCSSAQEAAQMVDAGAVSALVPLLSSSTRCCQEAALEALAAISQHSQQACQQLLAIQPTLQQQQQPAGPSMPASTAAGGSSSSSSKQPPAGLPSESAEQQEQQQAAMQRCAVVSQLLQLSRQRDAQLRCLVAKCISNFHPAAAAAPTQQLPGEVSEELLHAARVMLPHLVRLLPAAAAFANTAAETLEFITKHTHHPHYPPFAAAASKGAAAKGEAALLEAGSAAGDQGCLTEVPAVMAQLIAEREEFINLAVELDAVKQLMTILTKSSSVAAAAAATAQSHASLVAAAAAPGHSSSNGAPTTAAQAAAAAAKRARAAAAAGAAVDAAAGILKLRRGSLQALAVLAVGSETVRQQMVDSRLVPALVSALSEPDAGVRLGAANTLRGLSRSVRVLRGPTLTPDLAAPLVTLLQDSSSCEVQVAAAAAVCNVALDFSNLCTPLVEAGLTHALCGVLGSMLPELRFKALWALKNLAFACEPALQQQLLRELPWGVFRDLLMGDDDPRVRTQAAGLLQNLCKGGDDLEQVRQWSSNELIAVLEDQLDPRNYQTVFDAVTAAAAAAGGGDSGPAPSAAATAVDEAQLEAANARLPGLLYTTSNFCSGTEQHKAAVMGSKVPHMLLQYIKAAWAAAAEPGSAAARRGSTTPHRSPARASPAAAAAAGAGGSGQAGGSRDAASRALSKLGLPTVWCVINLLWYQDTTGGTAAAGAAGASGQGQAGAAAAGGDNAAAEAAARGSAAGDGVAVAGSGRGQGGGDGDVAMAAADEPRDGQAAVAARAAALRGLGFEQALRDLLEAHKATVAQQTATAAAMAAFAFGSDAAAAATPASAAASSWADSQDLMERLQTALQQLEPSIQMA